MPQSEVRNVERWYLMPAFVGCRYSCEFCSDVAMGRGGNKGKIAEELQKARFGEYDRIALSCNSIFESGGRDLVASILQAGWPLVIRVSESLTAADYRLLSRLVDPQAVSLEFVFTQWNENTESLIKEVEEKWNVVQYIWVVDRIGGLLAPFEALPRERWKKLRFYFCYKREAEDKYYSAGEVARVLEDLSLRYPDLKISPPEQYEIYHPESNPEREMDPVVDPNLRLRPRSEKPRVSYIIPTYNNAAHLLTTLRNIVRQQTKVPYEVIVVDDGSTDQTDKRLAQWLSQQNLVCGFTYLYLPRSGSRKMGDSQFRAGIARNLGVKWAEGEVLCFLDSDILIPPSYTDHLVDIHQHYDLIQPCRLQIQKRFSSGTHLWEDLVPGQHTQEKRGGYWEMFQAYTEDWNQTPMRWRYVSTFCLSIKRKQFKDLGWFRRTFLAYGFEDTDLGFRAHREGLRFYLSPQRVFHLHHPFLRSEYFHSALFKDLLLSRSVRTLFLNNLNDEIFRALEIYFNRDLLKNKWKDKLRGRLQIASARRWNQHLLGREES
ncbi:MAG: glycosyltransferase family 2 protein [Bdellovibrionales bacterium]|nr:glycosyltransferase family 2 protein [Bdellovibrionales bacterium]